jgi:hypothetical protein
MSETRRSERYFIKKRINDYPLMIQTFVAREE